MTGPTDAAVLIAALIATGNQRRAARDWAGAMAAFDQALATDPNNSDGRFNRAATMLDAGIPERAVADFADLLMRYPKDADAWLGYGAALKVLKRFDEAVVAFDHAVALGNAAAVATRGETLIELRRFTDALASFDRVLATNPGDLAALNNRGLCLFRLQRLNDALASFDALLRATPDHPVGLANRGAVLLALDRNTEAAGTFARLKTCAPDHGEAAGNLLLARIKDCDWTDYDSLKVKVEADIAAGKQGLTPFWLLMVSDDEALQLKSAATFIAKVAPVSTHPVWTGRRYGHDRIRLGYLAADFRQHPMSQVMSGLFRLHDRIKFEVTAFAYGPPTTHPMRERIRAACDNFFDVEAKSDREIAAFIVERETDILIDLSTLTRDGRPGISAQRAAPVQVNYMGHPGTAGTSANDYVLADALVIPPSQERHYAEKIARLPETYWVDDARSVAEQAPTRAEAGLPASGVVFCCFNTIVKITPDIFAAWMRLLAAVDGSVLWLLTESPSAKSNLRREATTRGIDPSRLVFAPKLPMEQHLARHCLADLFLDTVPYNAHTTATDALWMGVPIVSCTANSFASRVGLSLLTAIGLPELATSSLADYEALALQLARQPDERARYRAVIRRNRDTHSLFDTNRFRRHVERAYLMMMDRADREEPAASFTVPALVSP
ncbi:MAG: tetratricopeptide repeat protein [Alphaproteobacteria bacterium]|nr:tetratricopeptide repeat protein [Alphaproteobacteria bacterium]